MTSSLLKKCAVSTVPALLAAASLFGMATAADASPAGSASPPVGDAVPAANSSTPAPDWARAATTPCGEGAQLVGAWHLLDPAQHIGGVADLYWKNGTGENCLVVAATGSRYGQTNKIITAALRTSDGTHQKVDSGYYRYFAGPVSVPARHTCVDVLGRIQVINNGHTTDTYQVVANRVACS